MSNNSIISSIFPPSIVALCLPNFSKGRQNIESTTPIELCSTTPGVLIFFSLNGRRPDPLETWNRNTATCLQYDKPFTYETIVQSLPGEQSRLIGSGLRTIRALAVDEKLVHSSAVVTKTFYVKDVSDPLKATIKSKTNSLRLRKSTKCLDKSASESPKENDQKLEEPEIEDEVETYDAGNMDHDAGVEDESELPEFVPEITTEELVLDKIRSELTPITEEHSNEVDNHPYHDEKQFITPDVKDSSLQCVLTSECSDKSIQVYSEHKDVGSQATVALRYQAIQTIPQENDQHPLRTVRKGSTDNITKKKTCETQTSIDLMEMGTQTVDLGRKESTAITRRTSAQKGSRVSPGRGYWRQQMDHIASQLKAEACNNLEFRDSIMEQRITNMNRVSLHEGLDDLVLVLNFGLQRATIDDTEQ